MYRKRKAPLSFDWTPVVDDDNGPIPDIRMRHKQLDLDESGPSSYKTTYISAPASPVKGASVIHDDFDWNDEPAPIEVNINNYPFLDPAYEHFLDINEPGPPRRKRTTEACHYFQ